MAKSGHGRLDPSLDLFRLADIDRVGHDAVLVDAGDVALDILQRLGEVGLARGGHGDGGAADEEVSRQRQPGAAAGAGDGNHFVLEGIWVGHGLRIMEHLRMSVRMACYSKKKTPIYVSFLSTVNDLWSVTNKLNVSMHHNH